MHQPGSAELATTVALHDLTRDWIEALRSVLYQARVINTSPLADDHPLSEEYPFVRGPLTQALGRFRTRAHFDTRPPLQQGEEISYPVSLLFHPGTQDYNAFWTFVSGTYVLGQLTLTRHLWQHHSDMSWLTADRFLETMKMSVESRRKFRLTSRVWGLQGNPPSDHIVSNLELFELWTEEDGTYHRIIGNRYIRARGCVYNGCGFPLHLHQERYCSQHDSPQGV